MAAHDPVLDRMLRPLRDLRISVTDRCNFRCTYCMPLDRYDWIPKEKILRFEEIERLAQLFVSLGVRKIRVTGGEPLLRRNLDDLVARLAALKLEDLCLTTNAWEFAAHAAELRTAGLRRVNVSLDTLDPAKFERITRRDKLAAVLEGLEAAQAEGLTPIKLNMVVEKGVNEDELVTMAAFCRDRGFSMRAIEFMDVGNQNSWRLEKVVPRREILKIVGAAFPLRQAARTNASDPSDRWTWADGAPGDFGVIASVSAPFCGACSRARITADGQLVTCLFASTGIDLKTPLRAGASDDDLVELIRGAWGARRDRYSEERLADPRPSGSDEPPDRDKIEMITLGG